MIYRLVASSGEQSIPIEVKVDFRPGDQAQQARRVAVGELLAKLEAESASIEASGSDLVRVSIGNQIWAIV